eukprot:Pgem_evm1s3000
MSQTNASLSPPSYYEGDDKNGQTREFYEMKSKDPDMLNFGVEDVDIDCEKVDYNEEEPSTLRWYQKKLITVCIFALFVEMCERLTYYTIMGSQRSQLTSVYGYSSAQASSINAAFGVLCYITPVAGGWLADSYLGRTLLAAISALPSIESLGLYFCGVMAFITIGTGGIKPNICNYGGDQFVVDGPNEKENEREKKEQKSYFNWFYLMINVGAIVAFGYLVTLASEGSGEVPQDMGYFVAYMIAFASMLIAVLIFLAGTTRYTNKKPSGNSLQGLVYYLWESAKRTRKGKFALAGWVGICIFLMMAVVQAFITNEDIAKIMSYTSLGVAFFSCAALCICHKDNSHLDNIPDHYSGMMTTVEAKGTLDCIPILLIANVCFNISYNAMNGPWQSQACQSDLLIGSSQINGAFFNVADSFAILIFVPVLEWGVFPLIYKLTGKQVSRTQKLIAGLLISVLALALATLGEYLRRSSPVLDPPVYSNCAPDGVPMSSFTSFYMFVPFAIMGLAEILVNPVMLHFSYDQAPPRTRSLTQAFNLVACGALSNGFTAPLTTALSPFYTDNLNDGHLEYIYYVSAAFVYCI